MLEVHADRVYLASGSTDMRKSIDGLAVLVLESAVHGEVVCSGQRENAQSSLGERHSAL